MSSSSVCFVVGGLRLLLRLLLGGLPLGERTPLRFGLSERLRDAVLLRGRLERLGICTEKCVCVCVFSCVHHEKAPFTKPLMKDFSNFDPLGGASFFRRRQHARTHTFLLLCQHSVSLPC